MNTPAVLVGVRVATPSNDPPSDPACAGTISHATDATRSASALIAPEPVLVCAFADWRFSLFIRDLPPNEILGPGGQPLCPILAIKTSHFLAVSIRIGFLP